MVEDASEDTSRFEVGAKLLVGGDPAIVVLSRQVGRGRRAIKLDRRADRGSELTVPRAALPPLDTGSYYVADLVGAEVVDERGVRVGFVLRCHTGPCQ